MAIKKTGKFDLRCSGAVQSAFLLHPKYSRMKDAVDAGIQMVKAGDWAFAQYLPSSDAKLALKSCLPEIARKQQNNGMWFRGNTEAWAYGILKALKKADLLPQVIGENGLRYDPYQRFVIASDEWGFLVRRNIVQRPLHTDSALQAKLIANQGKQTTNGSWGDTISETALVMEKLLELGVPEDDPALAKGTQWLLSQFQDRIELRRLRCTIQNLFNTPDCRAEHKAAARILAHNKLTCCCFDMIPIIQTALALRVLVRMGLAKNPKVEAAFRGLLELQTNRKQPGQELPPVPIGGWCAWLYRRKLEAREKAKRR